MVLTQLKPFDMCLLFRDTSFNAKCREARNCGHGYVHVYAKRTCPCVSGAANALKATDLETRWPGPSKDSGFCVLARTPLTRSAAAIATR